MEFHPPRKDGHSRRGSVLYPRIAWAILTHHPEPLRHV
jgi:hypothetical protein